MQWPSPCGLRSVASTCRFRVGVTELESAVEVSLDYLTVQKIIRQRATQKILGDPQAPVRWSDETKTSCDQLVLQAIRDCGSAPFHYDRKLDGIAEPWRVYWLDCHSCRRLASDLPHLVQDLKPGAKLPALLAACGSLALFTWHPQERNSGGASAVAPFHTRTERINREHLAATAAAVQNLLLLLTALGMPNYWSSGTLIEDQLFNQLGIPTDSVLTAAVFIHYPQGSGATDVVGGKQAERRSKDHAWLREARYPLANGPN